MAKPENSDRHPQRRKRRRHGYRGYGSQLRSNPGGAIHWGRGFGGIGFPGEDGGLLLPESGILPENLRAGSLRDEA